MKKGLVIIKLGEKLVDEADKLIMLDKRKKLAKVLSNRRRKISFSQMKGLPNKTMDVVPGVESEYFQGDKKFVKISFSGEIIKSFQDQGLIDYLRMKVKNHYDNHNREVYNEKGNNFKNWDGEISS